MIEASLNWTDKDRFVGSATSRHSIVMDAAADKTANSPMELVLLSLCGCTASDVVGILRKKREPFNGLEVSAKAERADGYPAVYTSIHLTYLVHGQVSQKAMADAVRLSKEKYCSVSAMLEKTAKITYTIEHLSVKTGPHPLRGYFYIGSAAFLWGISATLGRAAFTGHLLPGGTSLGNIDPLILSQSRATLSLAVLLPVLLARRGASALRVPGRDLVRFFLLGVLGVAASNYFYYVAIQRTNVATAIILQYTAPVWVLLYTAVRGAQRPSSRRIAAVGLAVAGCALAVGFVGSGGFRMNMDKIGVAAALLAAFSFAFYNVGGHSVLARYDRWKVLLWVLVGTSAFWLCVNPPWKIIAAHYNREQWEFMLVFSLVSVLGPFSCYFAGLQHLEPTRAIVASCLEPVFSIVLTALVLGELVRPMQTVGIVLVLVAIVLIQLPERASRGEQLVVEPIE